MYSGIDQQFQNVCPFHGYLTESSATIPRGMSSHTRFQSGDFQMQMSLIDIHRKLNYLLEKMTSVDYLENTVFSVAARMNYLEAEVQLLKIKTGDLEEGFTFMLYHFDGLRLNCDSLAVDVTTLKKDFKLLEINEGRIRSILNQLLQIVQNYSGDVIEGPVDLKCNEETVETCSKIKQLHRSSDKGYDSVGSPLGNHPFAPFTGVEAASQSQDLSGPRQVQTEGLPGNVVTYLAELDRQMEGEEEDEAIFKSTGPIKTDEIKHTDLELELEYMTKVVHEQWHRIYPPDIRTQKRLLQITENKMGFVPPSAVAEDPRVPDDLSPTAVKIMENRQLITDMRAQNFDVIRFATYRTACKLRFIQKKTSLDMVDIWNIIESFRENGLNTLEPETELNASRVETILTSIYTQLNKRVPVSQQVEVRKCVNMLLNWLLSAYDSNSYGRMRVFSLKVVLSHMCAGKLMDKLRYIFTQLSDSSGYMMKTKFEQYLQDVLSLPTAVFEGPSFGYNETAVRSCFDGKSQVNVNDFLNVLTSEPGPQCLMWLPILHRMAHVENVFHPVQCEGCHRESFMGFRYRCQRCYNYHMCQDCFWRGRATGNHSRDHQMKEYTTYKSPAKQIGHSLKKSFRCVPNKAHNKPPQYPEYPEKTVDLSYIVSHSEETLSEPPTPIVIRNGFHDPTKGHFSSEVSSLGSNSPANKSPSRFNSNLSSIRTDEEHRLIARYASRLAADAKNAARSPVEMNFALDTNKAQRELIAQLENKNREIMREIQRLRMEQEAHAKQSADVQYNPTLMAELRQLRARKDELESRMQALQEGRKELVVQLETLMKMLKNQPTSPRSTPHSSPRSYSGYSPTNVGANTSGRNSAPTTAPTTPAMESSTLVGLGGDVQQAFSQMPSSAANVKSLRNDLLVAADSITGAMSSLVKELNSEQSASEDEEENLNGDLEIAENYIMQTREDLENWQKEVQKRLDQESKFIAELRAKQPRSATSSDIENDNYLHSDGEQYLRPDDDSNAATDDGESYVRTDDDSCVRTDEEDSELYDNHPKELPGEMSSSRYSTEEESYQQSDAESYIRTDDEEGGNTDWEESMKRWVNR